MGVSTAAPFVSPEVARAALVADLDAIDAAIDRIRGVSTDLVGNAFRIDVAHRLETQQRVLRGLSYRTFAEIADPPDGTHDDQLPAGVKVRDLLARRLRITTVEVRRRFRIAARIAPRRSLTGPPLPPELPALANAVSDGVVGEDHVYEVCKAIDALPAAATPADQEWAERVMVRHAREQDARFVEAVGRRLAEVINPDGIFDDRDRERRRCLTLGRQGPDGMSRLSGWLTPETRAYLEAIGAAVRPGHHVPGADQAVVDAATDTRTGPQRLHDALSWGLRAGLESGTLGHHRGIPVTVIATATVEQLEQAAGPDPRAPTLGPARTGGGSALPMRDLIRMAAGAIHYLAVFDRHGERPLYLGRSTRTASVDQRIVCHARDGGCTRPGCTVWGYHCEVMHTPDWHPNGATDVDKLHFGCGPDHRLITYGQVGTAVNEDGRLAWTIGDGSSQTNPVHHDDELLDDPPEPG